MSPIYEYRCGQGHRVEAVRRYGARDELLGCEECGHPMERVPSAHHAPPDGIYSYAPNTGDANKHDRWVENIKARKAREAGR